MNGFYPVLNELHDLAIKELPLAEAALFEHIWRKLIGWGKFEDEISINQLVAETSASRSTIARLVDNLEGKRWIIVTRQHGPGNCRLTNKIAIPACPMFKLRLGYTQFEHTYTQFEHRGMLNLTHTTDLLKDSLNRSSPQTPQTHSPKNVIGHDRSDDDDLDPESEKTELEKRLEKICQVQKAIRETFPQVKSNPLDNSVQKVIDEFRGDHEPLIAACEGLGTKTLEYPTAAAALKYVRSVAKGAGGAIKYPKAQNYSSDPEIDKAENWLRYCSEFWQSRIGEIYHILAFLAEKLEQPIEQVYAKREFLTIPLAELEKKRATTEECEAGKRESLRLSDDGKEGD